MPTHAEKKLLPYTQAQLFDLVADIERYPEFLPWCVGARIRERKGDEILGDLLIGYKMVRERFTSRVVLSRPDRIDVSYSEGPFKYLTNHWLFIPQEEGCLIDFYVDFEFRSRFLQGIVKVLFNEAVKRMVGAFEARAHALYDAPGKNGVAARQA
ncbi:MAG TPA: type II toxin-antitoxin system RatA family toxin [Stellaceae bacterium]|nr:type II toxin-antitoxin system RatA family toxin [Stellaceae bacterium]